MNEFNEIPNRQIKQRRSEGRDLSLIHTVEKEKQDVMSHKMDARIKDEATMDRGGCFEVFLSFWFSFLVPGRSRKLNGISQVDVAVVA